MEYSSDLVGAVTREMFCSYSNDFFEKLNYGCYNETLTVIGIICMVLLIARIIVGILQIMIK